MSRRSSLVSLALLFSSSLLGLELVGPPVQAQTTAPAADPAEQARQLLKQSDDLYANRRHETGVNHQIISLIDQAAKLMGGEKYETLWRLSRVQWWLADGETDTAKMAAQAEKGWRQAEKAVKLNPNGVEGQFWLSANIGQYSLAKGVLWAIAQGLEGKFLAPLEKSMKMNSRYECASPIRTKGNYYVNLPWPKQDIDKGVELLKQSLQLEPCGVRSHFFLAEAYEKDDKIPQAIAELDKILAMKPAGVDVGDLGRLQPRARAMKARLQKGG